MKCRCWKNAAGKDQLGDGAVALVRYDEAARAVKGQAPGGDHAAAAVGERVPVLESTPPAEANFVMVELAWLDTNRLPALSKAMPAGLLR